MLQLDAVGVDLANDDLLLNSVTNDTQLMRGATSWKRAREKDPLFLQIFIEITILIGDVVLNCIASTCTNSVVYLSF
jgi:hypothetical protein